MTIRRELRQVEEEAIVDVSCNVCGKSCRSEIDNFECLRFEEKWGYGSPWDCERWSGQMCIECSKKFRGWVESQGGHIDIAPYDLWDGGMALE